MEEDGSGEGRHERERNSDKIIDKAQIVISALGAALALHLAASAVVGSIRGDIHDIDLRVTALETEIKVGSERFADFRSTLAETQLSQIARLDKYEDGLRECERNIRPVK